MNKQYGELLDFDQEKSYKLADFNIQFLGKTKIEAPEYVNNHFEYFDYELEANGEKLIISWTPGTGFSAPCSFEFLNRKWAFDNSQKDGFIILPHEEFKSFTIPMILNKKYLQ
jgi:hypothetical protein